MIPRDSKKEQLVIPRDSDRGTVGALGVPRDSKKGTLGYARDLRDSPKNNILETASHLAASENRLRQ